MALKCCFIIFKDILLSPIKTNCRCAIQMYAKKKLMQLSLKLQGKSWFGFHLPEL